MPFGPGILCDGLGGTSAEKIVRSQWVVGEVLTVGEFQPLRRVSWHRDDGSSFGEPSNPKLIATLSLGASEKFRYFGLNRGPERAFFFTFDPSYCEIGPFQISHDTEPNWVWICSWNTVNLLV